MKKYIGIILAILWMTGCIDDRGNYDYIPSDEVFPVSIDGADTTFTCYVGDTVRISPAVSGTDNMNDLKYTWFLYQRGVAMSDEDTLAHTKDLTWRVDCDVNNYYLRFEIRDTLRDLFTYKSWSLNVSTPYGTGWFVLEDDGTDTDLDIIMADGSTSEDLMTASGSGRMEGKARKIVYKDRHPQEIENPDGTVDKEYKKAFSVISERDMRVYDAQNMAVLKYREDCFYEMPATLNPLNIETETSSDEVNIDGKFYLMSSGNIGKFGYPMMGLDGTENYHIFADGVLDSQHCYLWDETSASFVYAYTGNSSFISLNEAGDGEVNFGAVTNTGCTMKQFKFRQYTYVYGSVPATWTAYALWTNADGEDEILDLAFVSTNYPIQGVYSLPEGSSLADTEVMEAHQTEPKLFFAKGNVLYEHNVNSRTVLSERERTVYTFPAGEEIACIRHLVITSSSVDEPMNRLVVLTNGAEGWKLYGFEFINDGGEFDMTVSPASALIGSGKGTARYVMRMDNNRRF